MDKNTELLQVNMKGKTARFQIDQVGDNDEDDGMEEESVQRSFLKPDYDVYLTQYGNKSLRHYLTREVLPMEQNYRNIFSFGKSSFRRQQRPTMEQLRDEECNESCEGSLDTENPGPKKENGKIIKLGWINGVYVSSY